MMDKAVLYAINVSLDAYSVIISIIIASSIAMYKNIEKHVKWFAYTNIVAVIYGLSDIIMWISEGTDAKWKLFALPVSSFIYFFTGIFLFIFYIKYIIEYISNVQKLSKIYWYICVALAAIYLVFLALTPFYNFIYEILPDNVYQRARLFNVTVIIEVLLYCEALFIIIKYHKKLTTAENVGFASFIFCPFIAQIIQIANYGIALNSLGLTVSFFIIYINLNISIKTRLHKTEKQLTQQDTKKTEILNNGIINLATLIDYNDIGSNHIKRITQYSKLLAQTCKKIGLYDNIIDEHFINYIVKASEYHDIGNVNVPRAILGKKGRVTPEEYEEIKSHAAFGGEMITRILDVGFEEDFIQMASDICKYHHEHWDGSGYPEQKKGKSIPLSARIVAIADTFDALVTPRCYKKSVSFEEAFRIIDNESGKSFDPELVMEFIKIKNKIIEITNTYQDSALED